MCQTADTNSGNLVMKVNLPGSRSPGYAILSISVLLVLWQILADEIVKKSFYSAVFY